MNSEIPENPTVIAKDGTTVVMLAVSKSWTRGVMYLIILMMALMFVLGVILFYTYKDNERANEKIEQLEKLVNNTNGR